MNVLKMEVETIKLTEKDKRLIEIIEELDKFYRLDDGLPEPTNTKYVLKRLEELLEIAGSNSLIFAPFIIRMLGLGYILMLVSHSTDNPAMAFNDPQSLLWFAESGSESDLPTLAKIVRKTLDTAIETLKKYNIS